MTRESLPERRASYNFTVEFQGERYNVTIGHYHDGRPGEVFVNRLFTKTSAKVGTLLDGVCRDSAILVSLALQHGTSLQVIQHAITRDEDGEPSTIVGAIIDQIAKEGIYDEAGSRSEGREQVQPDQEPPGGAAGG